MKQRNIAIAAGVLLTLLVVAGCTAHPILSGQLTWVGADAPPPAGFLHGLWHGFISPFAFVLSLFSSRVCIYDIYNNGHWYDFGFVLGASAIFGGGAKGISSQGKK